MPAAILLINLIATTPNQITIDGVLHRNQMEAYNVNSFKVADMETGDSLHLSIDSVFAQWDSVNLYFRIKNDDTLWLGSYGDLFIAIDTGTVDGGAFSPREKHVRFSGYLPEFVYYIPDNGNNILYSWNGTGWDETYTGSNSGGAGSHPEFEVSIPITQIGDPHYVNLLFYTTTFRKGDGYADYTKNDTAFYSITVDGVKEEGYYLNGFSDQSGGEGADLDTVYVLWDSLNLYIFITTSNSASWDVAYGVGIDVDQVDGNGYYAGSSDAWGRKINFGNVLSHDPYAIDYEIYFWWDGAQGQITSAYLYRWDGAAWEDSTPGNSWYCYTGDASLGMQTLEISIPWQKIGGIHPEIHMSVWITGGNGSSAVDVIPHDDQISSNADEWNDSDTIFMYTVTIPDGDRFVDATVTAIETGNYSPDTLIMDNNPINISENGISFGYYDYSNWGNTPMGFLDPMDGIVDYTGFEENEMLLTMSTKNFWLTWSQDSLYIGYTYQAFDAGEGGDGDFFVYINVDSISRPADPQDPGGNYAMNWWGSDNIIFRTNMDYAIAVEDGGYYALYRYNVSADGWEEVYSSTAGNFPGSAYIGWDNGGNGNGVTEISISWSALGFPDYFSVVAFSHTEDAANIFGVSPPADSLYFNDLNFVINNSDGVDDTLKNFWGVYYLPAGIISPDKYLTHFLNPQDLEEDRQIESGLERIIRYDAKNNLLLIDPSYTGWLNIYDVSGRKVCSKLINKSGKIRINFLPTGIYFVKISNISCTFVKIK